MKGVLVTVVALCGCDRVFGLERPPQVDAPLEVDAPPPDEDGDGILDTIDACPGTFDTREDRDDDGLPDACDPHPDVRGDAIRSFASFSGGFDAWVPSNAYAWERGTSLHNLVDTAISLGASGIDRFATIELGYTAATYPATSSLRLTMQGATSAVTCFINYDPPDFGLFLTNSGSSSVSIQDPVQRIVLHADAAGTTCSNAAGSRTSTDVAGPDPTSFSISLENGLRIELRYAVVYESPG